MRNNEYEPEDDFLPKWFRGPVTNAEKANVGKTNEEICAGIQQRIRDSQGESMNGRQMTGDEERDLGLDDLRDPFTPPGPWGPTWDDDEPETRRD